ncbi:MAG: UPF0280 family protein [Pseudomonadota bacterium]|nr:UPF0280 family protein [Pseudomonadota bacterium]
MSGAVRARLADGRWHFQHGPIDCIVLAEGEAGAAAECIEHAWVRFGAVLEELVGELNLLRADLGSATGALVAPKGPIARRMVEACRAHASRGRFITAMAAVAGSVAEALIESFADPRIARAYVNNGGDIALHLRAGTSFDVGLVADPARGLAGLPLDGRFAIDATSKVRGIATSGWRGRSFSLGIADSVTVLAASASVADAAATVIGNAVNVDDARIVRRPANAVRDDSDLGNHLVICAVPLLSAASIDAALASGAAAARAAIERGRIIAAVLSLQGRFVVVEPAAAAPRPLERLSRSLVPC